jgi:hypothetical protein
MLKITSSNLGNEFENIIHGSIDFITDDTQIALDIYHGSIKDFYSGNVIVKCKHCGQWGAKQCECKKCGAPID